MYARLFHSQEAWLHGLFSFFAVFTVYNGQRIIKTTEETQSPRLLWTIRNKKWLVVSVVVSAISSLCVLLFIGINHWSIVVLLIVASLISLFYALRVNKKNLREIPYLKGHLIALCWMGIIVVYPHINAETASSFSMDLLAFYFLILGSSIPFDIRDLPYDGPNQKTIPQVFGVKGAKTMAVLCVIVFLWLTLWKHPFLMTNAFFMISVSALLLLISITNEKRTEAFYSIGIDGVLGLIGASTLIMDLF